MMQTRQLFDIFFLLLLIFITTHAFTPSYLPGRQHSCHKAQQQPDAAPSSNTKERLVMILTKLMQDPNRLPLGLECTEKEHAAISQLISDCCTDDDPSNRVKNVQAPDVLGEWNLLYTNSRTMIINKSLSGLGRSSSSMSDVASVTLKLTGTKYLGFCEFKERMGKGPDAFDVTVTGEWMLEAGNAVQGQPRTAIRCDLEKVQYGPTTNNADTWASLGPVKLLDYAYLSNDLMICIGNTNPDVVFVFEKTDQA